MAVIIGHASMDENGRFSGGTLGDQTGKEVCTREWYNKGWNKVIRPKNSKDAEKIAKMMKQATKNDNIGYDQSKRTTLYTEAEKVDWKLKNITTPCACDCSSLVAVCVNAAGIKIGNAVYTGNLATVLKNTGEFDILTDKKYLIQDTYLKRGDILLKEGSHTAVVLSDGSGASQKAQNNKKGSKTSGII